jgi:oxaloacetate decarboxylase alpha subunit
VLSAARWATVVDEVRALVEGRYGTPPRPLDPTVSRAVSLLSDGEGPEEPVVELGELRTRAAGLASSEEELLLMGLFGEEAEPLLQTIRGRSSREDTLVGGTVDQARAEKIREVVRIVQESGVAEVTIEEPDGLRVSVRRSDEAPPAVPESTAPLAVEEPAELPVEPRSDGVVRIEAPMVGTFYRAPQPGAPPFVEVGDAVAAGQTLCVLEAMKLMNEVKAEIDAVVRTINAENAEPVEFGQLLFELETASRLPLDAL